MIYESKKQTTAGMPFRFFVRRNTVLCVTLFSFFFCFFNSISAIIPIVSEGSCYSNTERGILFSIYLVVVLLLQQLEKYCAYGRDLDYEAKPDYVMLR
jgi:hypothetical protein